MCDSLKIVWPEEELYRVRNALSLHKLNMFATWKHALSIILALKQSQFKKISFTVPNTHSTRNLFQFLNKTIRLTRVVLYNNLTRKMFRNEKNLWNTGVDKWV